jgi:nitroimidazol reductase NimA-like FMN-containing flavoprotein (pyridoxamine 5'-phosphate oxidase superfamily)
MLMLAQMKDLAKQNNTCVLATIADRKPYCSLMAYVTNRDCTEIYMVTHRQTQKYQNLKKNPAVSLLIDTRDKSPRTKARAMTVEGVYQEIKDSDKEKKLRQKLLSAHPNLDEFMGNPDSKVLRIRIISFLLLDGLTQSTFREISAEG